MEFIKNIKRFFQKECWEPVYSTWDIEKYLDKKQMLIDNNIQVKTNIINMGIHFLGPRNAIHNKYNKIYDILVKEEDLQKAKFVITKTNRFG